MTASVIDKRRRTRLSSDPFKYDVTSRLALVDGLTEQQRAAQRRAAARIVVSHVPRAEALTMLRMLGLAPDEVPGA